MRVIPVLDLMGGQVVRGIAGRRAEYRPIVSPLARTSSPLDVAQGFRDHFGLTTLYVADLDAIAGLPTANATIGALHAAGFTLWVDAGLRVAADAKRLVDAGVSRLIAGLESLSGPEELATLVADQGTGKIVFSLDLKEGASLASSAWTEPGPIAIARRAMACGIGSILLLDLARVGVGQGTGTESLCAQLRKERPDLELTVGGGVRGRDDLARLQRQGADNVLIASALHDGTLRRADWD